MKYTFQELTIRPQNIRKTKGLDHYENVGIDTETYQGKVKLICDSFERSLEPNSFQDIMKFLTYYNYRGSMCWFFNIRFDFESILKWLEWDLVKELYINKSIYLNDRWEISFIPGKSIEIKDYVQEHLYKFYDLNNFLNKSLDEASRIFLNERKIDKIDRERLNLDLEYWNQKKRWIIQYCIKDAVLTKQLADYFWKIISDNLHFLPLHPYSKGAYSAEYMIKNCYIPTINDIPKNVLEYAYNSYSGGRFELLQKGYVEDAFIYDIKSAYPHQIRNLIDFTKGEFYRVKDFVEEADHGWYLTHIFSYHPVLSPFMKKMHNINTYPNGEFDVYLTQNEIQFILNNFKTSEIDVLQGYIFQPDEIIFPFKPEIEKLYKWKEKEKDEIIKYCVKILMNSLYGKFIQTVTGKTGKLFNPLYASEITANTRIDLLDFTLNEIGVDNAIMFSTDSVHSKKKIIPEWQDKTGLGEFQLDFIGEGCYLMTDVYSTWKKGFDYKNDEKSINNDTKEGRRKDRFRGFKLDVIESYNLKRKPIKTSIRIKDLLNIIGNDDCYNYFVSRPIHIAEILMQINVKQPENLNVWNWDNREIHINGDKKRLWEKDFKNGFDVWNQQIESSPLMV